MGERDHGSTGEPGGSPSTNPVAYLYALAPALVVLVVGPGLALLVRPAVPLAPGPARWVGLPVVLAGLGLAGWGVHAFARAGTTPSPVKTPGRLVTGGPLAHTRNPIYLGTVLAAVGEAALLGSPLVAGYALLLWLAYHLLVVVHEEPTLREYHGEAYEAYCEEVPRWV